MIPARIKHLIPVHLHPVAADLLDRTDHEGNEMVLRLPRDTNPVAKEVAVFEAAGLIYLMGVSTEYEIWKWTLPSDVPSVSGCFVAPLVERRS